MRKKLSVAQLIGVIIAGLLPLPDGMFIWRTYTMFDNISKKEMSLNNLMTTQQIGGGPYIYWVFNAVLIVMIGYCIIELFFEDKVIRKKQMIAIPGVVLLLCVIMIAASCNYNDTFMWYGETRYAAVSMGFLAYIEILVLIGVALIECYKQFKCEE